MEEEAFAAYLIFTKLENEERLVRRQNLASLKGTDDPFLLEEEIFRKFSQDAMLGPYAGAEAARQLYEPVEDSVRASVLYFLANGSYQSCVGNSHFAAMSQPSVSRNIKPICSLVVEHKNAKISLPSTAEHYNSIKRDFHNKFGIKGVIGAIDYTHVAIIAPSSSTVGVVPHDYMNRKGYYSVNVEAVCDDELIFRHVNARFPGTREADQGEHIGSFYVAIGILGLSFGAVASYAYRKPFLR